MADEKGTNIGYFSSQEPNAMFDPESAPALPQVDSASQAWMCVTIIRATIVAQYTHTSIHILPAIALLYTCTMAPE